MAQARHLIDIFDDAIFDPEVFDTSDRGFFIRARRKRNYGRSDYTQPKRFQTTSNDNNFKLPTKE